MFNDVAGLDLFFSNTHEKHTLPVMRSVCWSTELQRVVPLPDQSGETFEDRLKKQWAAIIRRPGILVVDQQRSICTSIFAEKFGSDGKW